MTWMFWNVLCEIPGFYPGVTRVLSIPSDVWSILLRNFHFHLEATVGFNVHKCDIFPYWRGSTLVLTLQNFNINATICKSYRTPSRVNESCAWKFFWYGQSYCVSLNMVLILRYIFHAKYPRYPIFLCLWTVFKWSVWLLQPCHWNSTVFSIQST